MSIFNIFRRRSPVEASYTPRERMLFRYFDGQKHVTADPMVLYKRIMDKGPTLAIDIKVATSISKDASKKHDELIRTIREIFSVQPLEQGGLTETETAELLDAFLSYIDSLKKNTKQAPISPAATSPSSSLSPAAVPPTPNGLASGSTATEPNTEPLQPSPLA